MEKTPLYYRILFGARLRRKSAARDLEYSRKASLLVTIYIMAFAMLSLFSVLSFARDDHVHAFINTLVLGITVCGYLYLRLRGDLLVNSFFVIGILSAQFASDFLSDTNRAM